MWRQSDYSPFSGPTLPPELWWLNLILTVLRTRQDPFLWYRVYLVGYGGAVGGEETETASPEEEQTEKESAPLLNQVHT